MATVVTNVGITAINNASTGGPRINVTQFRVGSAFGYTPTTNMTTLQGTSLYTGPITNYTVLPGDMVEYECILDQAVGPFNFGEIGLYLDTGELFSLTSLTQLRFKSAQNLGTNELGNRFIIRIQVAIQNAPYVLNFQNIAISSRLPWAEDWRNATYVNATTATVSTDVSSLFHVGRAVKASFGSSYSYSYISSVSFGSGTTTIVLQDPILTASLTALDYGIMEASQPNAEAYIRRAIRTIGTYGVWIDNAEPILTIRDLDAGTNSKVYRYVTSNTSLSLRLYDDAISSFTDVMVLNRVGLNLASIIFPNGQIGIGGTPSVGVGLDIYSSAQFRSAISISGSINASLPSGTTNDWSPSGLSGASIIRVDTNSSGSSLSGAAFTGNRQIKIINLGPGLLNLLPENSGSSASNRFSLVNNAILRIAAGGSVTIWADPTSSRWRADSYGADFAPGMIVEWYGLSSNVPAGWAICDGTNGTPDSRGRVAIGAGGSYTLGELGGSVTVSGTTQTAGSHSHTINPAGSHTHSAGGGDHTHTTDPTILSGANLPQHNHAVYVKTANDSDDEVSGLARSDARAFVFNRDNAVGPFGYTLTNNQGTSLIDNAGVASPSGHNHTIPSSGSHTHTTDNQGSHSHSESIDPGHTHNLNPVSTLQPYYAVFKIMKL